jgi:release factor glutamine methyltransferase
LLPSVRKWKIDALDKSNEALSLARENASQCRLEDRVHFAQSDWFTHVTDRYDLIISNPPYLTESEIAVAEPEVKDFDPLSALIATEEGLADLKIILTQAPKFLNNEGWVICETGITQHDTLAEISKQAGYRNCLGLNDLSGRPRFWKAQKSL